MKGRKAAVSTGLLLVLLLGAGCGGAIPNTPVDPGLPSRQPPSGRLGDTLTVVDFSGIPLTVTATRIVDPLQPAAAAPGPQYPSPGTRDVGVDLRVAERADLIMDTVRAANVTVVDRQGDRYQAADVPGNGPPGCRTFPKEPRYLFPGTTVTGCVVFELPLGREVREIVFTPASDPVTGARSQSATWSVDGRRAQNSG